MITIKQKVKPAKEMGDKVPNDITIELEEQYNNKSGSYKTKEKEFFVNDVDLGKGLGRYKITFIGTPKIIIDKLAFTYPAPKEQHQNIKNTCKDMYAFSDLDKYYAHNYFLNINGHVLKISFAPHNKSYNYLRIEYNPAKHKCNKKILEIMKKLLPNGMEKIKIRISRLDIALDYPCIKPKHLMVNAKGFSLSKVYTDSNDNIETNYIGSPNSKIQYKVYDKTKEQQSKGKIITQHTRIEASIRKVSYQELMIINPFEKLQLFYSISSNKKTLIQTAKTHGLQQALTLLTKKKRILQEVRLKELACGWWIPNDILPKYLIKINNINLFNRLEHHPEQTT